MDKVTVVLNGTDKNPHQIYGLKQNPFPQIAKREVLKQMLELNSLGGEPIKTKEEIAARLPSWSPEFIALCEKAFVPGKRVTFDVTINLERS